MFTCAEEERDTMPPRGQKRNTIVINLNSYYYYLEKWEEMVGGILERFIFAGKLFCHHGID